jgi:AraC-like DNA-binding protein
MSAASSLKSTNKVSFYLNCMSARGFPAAVVLEGSGLEEEEVHAELFRPTPGQYRRIISNILRLTGDPFTGIAFGSEFKINYLGVMGYAALSSATLAQSRELWNRYDVLNDSILDHPNQIRDGKWFCTISEIFPLGDLLPFAIEEFVSQTIEIASNLTNRPFPIVEMHLTYPQPASMEKYNERFNCPIFFNQPRNIIEFDINTLQYPVSLANAEVFRLCESQCRQLVSQLESGDLLSNRIRNTLVRSPGKFPTLEEMASILKMGSRTLRRRLVKEELTYQQILDETRKDLAIQYLECTSLTPKEIGYLLGFNSVSNFRRAFKGWTVELSGGCVANG